MADPPTTYGQRFRWTDDEAETPARFADLVQAMATAAVAAGRPTDLSHMMAAAGRRGWEVSGIRAGPPMRPVFLARAAEH